MSSRAGSHHPDWFGCVAEEFAGELKGSPPPGSNLRVAQLCLRLVEQCKASSRHAGLSPLVNLMIETLVIPFWNACPFRTVLVCLDSISTIVSLSRLRNLVLSK